MLTLLLAIDLIKETALLTFNDHQRIAAVLGFVPTTKASLTSFVKNHGERQDAIQEAPSSQYKRAKGKQI
jgi:hypothetical protein